MDEDYKIFIVPKEKNTIQKGGGKAASPSANLGGSGLNQETILLNTDTFKSLCMIAKTAQGKEMRKYYVKLENIIIN